MLKPFWLGLAHLRVQRERVVPGVSAIFNFSFLIRFFLDWFCLFISYLCYFLFFSFLFSFSFPSFFPFSFFQNARNFPQICELLLTHVDFFFKVMHFLLNSQTLFSKSVKFFKIHELFSKHLNFSLHSSFFVNLSTFFKFMIIFAK